jgi:hypothetical protein
MYVHELMRNLSHAHDLAAGASWRGDTAGEGRHLGRLRGVFPRAAGGLQGSVGGSRRRAVHAVRGLPGAVLPDRCMCVRAFVGEVVYMYACRSVT